MTLPGNSNAGFVLFLISHIGLGLGLLGLLGLPVQATERAPTAELRVAEEDGTGDKDRGIPHEVTSLHGHISSRLGLWGLWQSLHSIPTLC